MRACQSTSTLLAIPLFVATALCSPSVQASGLWEVVRNEQGVSVALHEESGSNYKSFRGETLITAPVETVIQALTHSSACRLWRYRCKSAIALGDNYHFSVNDLPWPLSDRFVITRNTLHQRSAQEVILKITHTPLAQLPAKLANRLPDHVGLVEMREYSGYWKIEAQHSGSLKVTMQMHGDPAGNVPAAVVNSGIVNNPFNTLLNLRAHIESASQNH